MSSDVIGGGGDTVYALACTCPECGCQFRRNGQWVYKRNKNDRNVYYCSWTCFNKSEKGKPVKLKGAKIYGNERS